MALKSLSKSPLKFSILYLVFFFSLSFSPFHSVSFTFWIFSLRPETKRAGRENGGKSLEEK